MSNKSNSVEEKMAKLRELAAWFESDEFSLSEASKTFKEATVLAGEIEHDLTEMKNTVQELKQSFEEV